MTALLVSGLLALGVALALPVRPPGPGRRAASVPADRSWLGRWRPLWAGAALLAGATFAPGHLGLPVGIAGAVAVWVIVGRAESPGSRRTREALRRELPVLVDLLADALDAGLSIGQALSVVTAALPGAAADTLAGPRARLDLGEPAELVWHELAGHPQLRPLGRALARSQVSGAAVATSMRLLADDLAERARVEVEMQARSVGVRAALPLGLCLLPAFVLLGVVPMVAGAVGAIAW